MDKARPQQSYKNAGLRRNDEAHDSLRLLARMIARVVMGSTVPEEHPERREDGSPVPASPGTGGRPVRDKHHRKNSRGGREGAAQPPGGQPAGQGAGGGPAAGDAPGQSPR